jgi:hypothetical protein
MRARSALMFAMLLLPVAGHAGVKTVWAVNDGEKIDRDDQHHPAKSGNSAWDGKKVRIFGARNEIVAFQVIVEADRDGIKSLSARLPELVQGREKIVYAAPDRDPSRYVQTWERHGWLGGWQAYWLWRDRKGLIGSPASALSSLLFLYAILTRMWTRVDVPSWMMPAAALALPLPAVRLAVRIGCSWRWFGPVFALLAPLREPYANFLNAWATVRSLHGYAKARWEGRGWYGLKPSTRTRRAPRWWRTGGVWARF